LVEDDEPAISIASHLDQLGYTCSKELLSIFEPNGYDGLGTPGQGNGPTYAAWIDGNYRQLMRLSGVAERDLEIVYRKLMKEQARYTWKPVEGASELLNKIRNNNKQLAICSNWETPLLNDLVKQNFDPSQFDAIVYSAHVGARKPNPAIFQLICQDMQLAAGDMCFIGDNWMTDIRGALRMGFAPIWIRRDQPSKKLDHIVCEINQLSDLSTLIDSS